MVKDKTKGDAPRGSITKAGSAKLTTPTMRPIDAPYMPQDRTSIEIKKADNGGYVINHSGYKGGKSFNRDIVAHNSNHAKKLIISLVP